LSSISIIPKLKGGMRKGLKRTKDKRVTLEERKLRKIRQGIKKLGKNIKKTEDFIKKEGIRID